MQSARPQQKSRCRQNLEIRYFLFVIIIIESADQPHTATRSGPPAALS